MTLDSLRPLRLLLLALLSLAASPAPALLLRAAPEETEAVLVESARRLRQDVEFLASDALGGRDSGEPGLEVAAEYLAARFREAGLEPAGDHGTFFQAFSVPSGATMLGEPAATVTVGAEATLRWAAGVDVEPFGYAESENGIGGLVEAPLVFAGYGITTTAEEAKKGLEWDDYAGLAVEGKVVILLRFTPRYRRADGPFGGRRSPHAPFTAKLRNAAEHGAAGVVFVTPPGSDEEGVYAIAHRASPRRPTLPALVARRDAVDTLLHARGDSLAGIARAMDESLRPHSFALEGASIRFATARRYLRLRNVAARLPGSDPRLAAEAVLVGGHYDHIGRFGNQVAPKSLGQIHNGADDNASGTAAVLELARRLAAGPRPRRTVLFVAFSGEEIGLLGSRAWVEAPRRFVARGFARARLDPPPPARGKRGGGPGDGIGRDPVAASGAGAGAPRELLLEGGTPLLATGKFRGNGVEVVDPAGEKVWVAASSLQRRSGPWPLQRTVAMVNLDMVGHAGDDGSVQVLGAASSKGFAALLDRASAASGVPCRLPKGRGFSGGSDHMHFERRSIPVLFFFTGIHKLYNTPGDDPETLRYPQEARIVSLVESVTRSLAGSDERPAFDPAVLAREATRSHGRPRLGVVIDPKFAGAGARVSEVQPDSVAEKAGLKPGDVIVRFAGTRIADLPDLLEALESSAQGRVKLAVRRGEEETETELTAEFPSGGGGFGVRFGSVPDYAFAEKGVRFEDIRDGTPAAKAGVKAGDVLVRWGGVEVEDVEHWTTLLGRQKPGDRVKIVLRRGKERIELEVVLEAR